MAKHVCLNGTMVNTDVYSSPVPVIGLYIAGVSLVCFLLIVCDVWAGFRSKKLWFPCRFFSFNSITLTLISVATKIPVDLTTSMPSEQDQLAKLSGTVFICMTMSFMLPSISINAEFESYANVTALSIFVITVVVNICIQMATGVIFSFIAEHAIILFCMLFLLIRLWSSVTIINSFKRTYVGIDQNKDFMRQIRGMFARLKLCYLYSYHSCLQLYSCRTPDLADVGIVCMVCSIVLVQATVRSLGLKTVQVCEGASDYGWSMWGVLVTQILTVAVVSLVTGLRSLNNIAHDNKSFFVVWICVLLTGQRYVEFRYLFSSKNLPKFLFKGFHYFIYMPLLFIDAAIALMNVAVHLISVRLINVCGFLVNTNQEDENLKELRIELSNTQVDVENWFLKKGVEDFERWLKINKKSSLEHLPALLSTVPPAEEPFVGLSRQGIKISSLSVVLIANAMMTMPSTLGTVNIANVLREAFEIIHFVDNTVNVQSSSDRLQSMLAKTIHKYGPLSSRYPSERLLEQILRPSLRHEISVYRHLPTAASDAIVSATHQIAFFINRTTELPVAVYTHILESPVEEYHERNHQTSATNMPAEAVHMQVQGTTDPTTSSAVESVGEIQEDEHAAEQRV